MELFLLHLGLVYIYFTFLERQTSNLVILNLFSDSLGFCQLFLDCPLETCLLRNGQRPQPLPNETIHLMERKIEKPNPEKNSWEHNSLMIQSTACPVEARYPTLCHLSAVLWAPCKTCSTVWDWPFSYRPRGIVWRNKLTEEV